mmetsp:Transcript_2354/g.7202  ORF Transcript_2354/g.7202 Transcript_2354/m.7202 type:complete len:262 (-) Transcript_2354:230-1015(-)
MATPRSAWTNAGASLTPSPTNATHSPASCKRLMHSTLPEGNTSAVTFPASIPISCATTLAVSELSPVSMCTLMCMAPLSTATVRAASSLALSISPSTASVLPSTDTTIAVCPWRSRNSIASIVLGRTVIGLFWRHRRLPMWTLWPSTTHRMPMPASLENSIGSASGSVSPGPIPSSAALARTPRARGCSLLCSALAAKYSAILMASSRTPCTTAVLRWRPERGFSPAPGSLDGCCSASAFAGLTAPSPDPAAAFFRCRTSP